MFYLGGHLRELRHEAVSAVAGQELLRDAGQRLQVLPRLRELQLQRLHHRKVLRQRSRVSADENKPTISLLV